MITLQDITLRRGQKLLCKGANLTIHRGEKVALIGSNGTGKSSLLSLLRDANTTRIDEIALDSGRISLPKGIEIASVEQEVAATSRPAIEYVIDVDTRYRHLERELASYEGIESSFHSTASAQGVERAFHSTASDQGIESIFDSTAASDQGIESVFHSTKAGAQGVESNFHSTTTSLASHNAFPSLARLASLHEQMSAIDGYSIRARASALLKGLGFLEEDMQKSVAEFSGGWRMRLNLARAMLLYSDLLLLDEPTNHLDLDATYFLEGYLRAYAGTLILISHDRDFIDAVAGEIVHLSGGKLRTYSGNYSAFARAYTEQLALQSKLAAKISRQREQMEGFIARFRYGTKARQAQSRIKALSRLKESSPLLLEAGINFRFKEPNSLPNPLITISHIDIGYKTSGLGAKNAGAKNAEAGSQGAKNTGVTGVKNARIAEVGNSGVKNAGKKSGKSQGAISKDAGSAGAISARVVLRDVSLSITPSSRISILGKNGAGKSTLIKLLAGKLEPLNMESVELNPHALYLRAQGLRVGYFAQHQIEALCLAKSPLEQLAAIAPSVREKDLREYLGGFGIKDERALAPIAPFSGGEKAILALALLIYTAPNLLLLDEPTNHLDINMREALSLALQSFKGACVIISHDRHLLRANTDEFYLAHDGALTPFYGSLEDYHDFVLGRVSANGFARKEPVSASKQVGKNTQSKEFVQGKPPAKTPSKSMDKKEQKRAKAAARAKLSPVKAKIKELEEQSSAMQSELARLEARLANNALYEEKNKDELARVLDRQAVLALELKKSEEAWLIALEELEALEGEK